METVLTESRSRSMLAGVVSCLDFYNEHKNTSRSVVEVQALFSGCLHAMNLGAISL